MQLLETTLGRLFPSGEMDAITRSLLTDNIPTDQSPPVASINQMSADEATPSNLIWDDESHLGQFLPLDTGTDDLHVHTGLQDPASYSQSMLAGAQSPDSMTTTNQENDFLNNYFLHYHPLYPILHEATFRSEWEGRTSTSPHWPILANIVLAFGAWLTAHARPGSDKSYFLKSRDGFQKVSFADRGDITLIQSLVLLSEFSQKQGSPEESAHYIGTAVRMAIAHNLHISLPIQQSNILNQEIGRRVWWSVYCAESCSAKIYGRPLLLPEEMLITVEPVSNIDESVRCPLLIRLTS